MLFVNLPPYQLFFQLQQSTSCLLRLEPSVASPDEGYNDTDESICLGGVFPSVFFTQGILVSLGRVWLEPERHLVKHRSLKIGDEPIAMRLHLRLATLDGGEGIGVPKRQLLRLLKPSRRFSVMRTSPPPFFNKLYFCRLEGEDSQAIGVRKCANSIASTLRMPFA